MSSTHSKPDSVYAYNGNDLDTIRKRHYHQALVFTHTNAGIRWLDIVEDIIRRNGVDARADLDFVLGKSTGGVMYLNESSDIYEAAVTILSATEEQLKRCAIRPRDVDRPHKQQSTQMKQYLSNIRDLQARGC